MCFILEHLIFLFQRLELCQPFLSVYLNHSDHVVSTAQIALLTASFLSSSGQMYAMLNYAQADYSGRHTTRVAALVNQLMGSE
jgi:hypothetical protein